MLNRPRVPSELPPMTNPTTTTTDSLFAPLPVRARGTLEIFDTAFKLFRRYAGVLLGWSFLSSVINLLQPVGFFLYVFTMPLLFGAVACVIAAAVRGQNVRFSQVWGFTKPRYGALLGVLILAWVLFFVVLLAATFGVLLVGIGFASATAGFGSLVAILAYIVGTLIGLVLGSLMLAILVGWFVLSPIVACLEDQHRGSSSMGRAWALFNGNWRKACAVSLILTLATLSALVITGSFIGIVFYGGWDKFLGADASGSEFWSLMVGYGGFSTVFLTALMPVLSLVVGVFYLDLRTRKEALDLEWTNYAAKPETLPDRTPAFQHQVAPPQVAAPLLEVTPSALDAGAVGYAPASGAPAATVPSTSEQFAPQPPSPPPFAPTPIPPTEFAPAINPAMPTVHSVPPMMPPTAPAATPLMASTAPATSPLSPAVTSTTEGGIPTSDTNSADSFASFASQIESAPALNISAASTQTQRDLSPFPTAPAPASSGASTQHASSPSLEAPAPISSGAQPSFSSAPEVLISPSQPAGAELFVPTLQNAPSSVQQPVSAPVEVITPVQPFTPPPVPSPPVPPAPQPAPAETSSFAPPRRIVRDEDDDFPSSFGGGARR